MLALHPLARLPLLQPGLAFCLKTLLRWAVALLGLRLDVPVWTINFRDLAAFRNLHFWTPEPSR